MKPHFFILVFLLAFSGCTKKVTQREVIHAINPEFQRVPACLSQGLCIAQKQHVRKKNNSEHELAHATLQIALGLRDAIRGRIHTISPLSRSTLFNLESLPVQLELQSSYTVDNDYMTTHLISTHKHGITAHKITKHVHEEAETKLQTTLALKREPAGNSFNQDLLETIFDTIETGYASNEISIMLSSNDRTVRLCRQGCDLTMNIALQPDAITFHIDGYGLDTRQFLTTLCGIPEMLPSHVKKEAVMKKNLLFVLMPRGFQDLEFTLPYNALSKAGYNVKIAGLTSGTCVGSAGTQVTPDKILSAMSIADFETYDAIIIPGGIESPTFLWNNKELQAVVTYFHEHNKLVATICYASIVPAQAGLLKNRQATVYPTDEAKEIFVQNGVIFNDQLCISLENEQIITAQSPKAIEPFIANILKQLEMHPTQKEPSHV